MRHNCSYPLDQRGTEMEQARVGGGAGGGGVRGHGGGGGGGAGG